MLEEMGSTQWLDWKVFMTLTPFVQDQERADVRAALVALAIWNVQIAKAQGAWDASKRKRGRRPEMRALGDFLLNWGDSDMKPKPRKLTGREMFERIKDSFEALGMQPVKR